MKTYLIQRNVPGAGNFSAAERKSLARRSCKVLLEMGNDKIQWVHSYITADNLWCIYKAQDIELIKKHARRGDFPANFIHEVVGTFSPTTAELTV